MSNAPEPQIEEVVAYTCAAILKRFRAEVDILDGALRHGDIDLAVTVSLHLSDMMAKPSTEPTTPHTGILFRSLRDMFPNEMLSFITSVVTNDGPGSRYVEAHNRHCQALTMYGIGSEEVE